MPAWTAAQAAAAAGAGIGDLGGAAFSFGLNQAGAAIQNRRQKEAYRKAVRWRVGDLRKAGINPILAAGMGLGGGIGGMSAGGAAGPTNLGGTAQRMAQASLAGEKASQVKPEALANINMMDAISGHHGASARRENAARMELEARTRQLDATLPQVQAESDFRTKMATDMGDLYDKAAAHIGPYTPLLGLLPGFAGLGAFAARARLVGAANSAKGVMKQAPDLARRARAWLKRGKSPRPGAHPGGRPGGLGPPSNKPRGKPRLRGGDYRERRD